MNTVKEYLLGESKLPISIEELSSYPIPGYTTYITKDLHDYIIPFHGHQFSWNLLLLTSDLHHGEEEEPLLLAALTAAALNREFSLMPGEVTPLGAPTRKDSLMEAYLFTVPFLFPDLLKNQSILMALPITREEREFILEHGEKPFVLKLIRDEVDIADFYRLSAV